MVNCKLCGKKDLKGLRGLAVHIGMKHKKADVAITITILIILSMMALFIIGNPLELEKSKLNLTFDDLEQATVALITCEPTNTFYFVEEEGIECEMAGFNKTNMNVSIIFNNPSTGDFQYFIQFGFNNGSTALDGLPQGEHSVKVYFHEKQIENKMKLRQSPKIQIYSREEYNRLKTENGIWFLGGLAAITTIVVTLHQFLIKSVPYQ